MVPSPVAIFPSGPLYFLAGLMLGLFVAWWRQLRVRRRLGRLLTLLEQAPSPGGAVELKAAAKFPIPRLFSLVTRQNEQLQALRSQLADGQCLLAAAPIGYLQVDDENRLTHWNPMTRKLLGIEPGPEQQRLGRLLLEVVRSYELDRLIEGAREQQGCVEAEWSFPPVPPERKSVPVRGLGIPLSHGSVGVYLEDRREAVLLAQQHNRWTSDVAHELKTPLTSIRLVTEMIQPRVEGSLRPWLDRLLSETQRLSSLVQDLLELSRLDLQPARALSLKSVDLPRLVRSAWETLAPLSNAKQLRLEYVGPAQLSLQADEQRLYRVLLNLLDNSIQYSYCDRPIRVCLSTALAEASNGSPELAEAESVILEVIDYGPGFPDAAIPYVFERFYRADAARGARSNPSPEAISSGPAPGGSGLGLAIVQQIVEAHGGLVSAANHPETSGAWLRLRLPRSQAVPQSINVTALP